MSRVLFTPIVVGENRDVDRVNDYFDDLETASVQVDSKNFAEEGMDARPFEAHVVATRAGQIIVESTRNPATLAIQAAFTQFAHNGTAFRQGALADLLAGEAYRFRSRIWFEPSISSGLGLFNGTLVLRLAWFNGAITQALTGSVKGWMRPGQIEWMHACCFVEGWLFGPLTNIQWVDVQYTWQPIAGNEAFPSTSVYWCDKFRRVEQV